MTAGGRARQSTDTTSWELEAKADHSWTAKRKQPFLIDQDFRLTIRLRTGKYWCWESTRIHLIIYCLVRSTADIGSAGHWKEPMESSHKGVMTILQDRIL